MTSQEESVFHYATPSPDMKVIQRAMAFMLAGVTVVLVMVLWTAIIPFGVALAIYVAYVVVAIATLPFASFSIRRSRVVIGPDQLVLRRWFEKREIAWQDVVSVDLGKYEPRTLSEKLFRGATDMPAVMVHLNRFHFGLTVQGTNMVLLYLDHAQRFVEEARRRLSA